MGNASSTTGSTMNPSNTNASESASASTPMHVSIRDKLPKSTVPPIVAPTVSPTKPPMNSAEMSSSVSNNIKRVSGASDKNTQVSDNAKMAKDAAKIIGSVPGQPMNLVNLVNLAELDTVAGRSINMTGGNYDMDGGDIADSEIDVNIVPLSTFGHTFKGGAGEQMSDSVINVEFTDANDQGNIQNELMQGGGTASEFDAGKLLQSIMQLGGAAHDSDTASTATSVSPSSYEVRPKKNENGKKKKPYSSVKRSEFSDSFIDYMDEDDDSSSSDDSNEFSTESALEFNSDSEPVDFEYIGKQAKKAMKKRYESDTGVSPDLQMMTPSEVYVMTDSSDRIGGVTLRSFADPLGNRNGKKKSKKDKKYRRF